MSLRFKYSIVLLILCTSLYGQELTESDYLAWIQTNRHSLVSAAGTDGVVYKVSYLPRQYVALKLHNTGSSLSESENENQSTQYFLIQISAYAEEDMMRYDLDNPEEYYQRVKYYAFDVANDIRLVVDNDTLKPRDVSFQRTYSVKPAIELMVVFDKEFQGSPEEIIIELLDPVFTNRVHKFRFDATFLTQLPKIKP